MFDKQKLLAQLESLMSLAAANSIDYQGEHFSHVKNVAEDLAAKLQQIAEEEAAAEKASAEAEDGLRSHTLQDLVEKYEILYFIWNRGKSSFMTFAVETSDSDLAGARIAGIRTFFDSFKHKVNAKKWNGYQYFYILIPINDVPKTFKEGLLTFSEFEDGMTHLQMY